MSNDFFVSTTTNVRHTVALAIIMDLDVVDMVGVRASIRVIETIIFIMAVAADIGVVMDMAMAAMAEATMTMTKAKAVDVAIISIMITRTET